MAPLVQHIGEIEQLLRRHNLRVTPPRLAILEEIFSRQEHVHPETLLAVLKKKGKKVSRATLYRTLSILIEKGLMRKMHFENKQPEYDQNYGIAEHDHVICLNCGKTIEFRDEQLRLREQEICRQMNFRPVRRNVQIFGYCNDAERCQAEGHTLHKVPGAIFWTTDEPEGE